MRTTLTVALAGLAIACGPSQDEGADLEVARNDGAAAASVGPAEAPVDLGEGLILTVLQRGTGEFVPSGGRVRVHYEAHVVAVAEEPTAEAAAAEDPAAEEPATEEPASAEPAADAALDAAAQEPETATAQVEVGEPQSAAPPAPASEPPAEAATEPEASQAPTEATEAPTEVATDAAEAAPAAPELPRRFDSSRVRGVPDTWDLSRTASPRLIEGLRRGLNGMTVGSRVTLRVPAALAWGDEGLPGVGVPPRAEILYEIELIEVLP